MTLLEFSRGPALQVGLIVLIAGVTWRLTRLALMPRTRDPALPRPGGPSPVQGGLRVVFQRFWPSAPFREQATLPTVLAYTFHLGMLIILLGGTPHILFFAGFTGFTWPGLPKDIIDVVSALTLGALFFVLIRRLYHPVRRLLSTLDDYISWLVTMLPVLTGLMATASMGGRYETILSVHLLSVACLMIWFPFGKLMHAFLFVVSRGTTGARYLPRGGRL